MSWMGAKDEDCCVTSRLFQTFVPSLVLFPCLLKGMSGWVTEAKAW